MQLPITITTNVTQDELRIFVKQSLFKSFKYLKYLKYYFCFLIIMILLNASATEQDLDWTYYLRIAAYILVPFILWHSLIRVGAKNTYKEKKDDFDHSIYTFSDDGINFQSATVEAKLSWDAFKKVDIDKDFLWLFVAKNQAYILPIRCFENKETLDAVYQLTKDNIK